MKESSFNSGTEEGMSSDAEGSDVMNKHVWNGLRLKETDLYEVGEVNQETDSRDWVTQLK